MGYELPVLNGTAAVLICDSEYQRESYAWREVFVD